MVIYRPIKNGEKTDLPINSMVIFHNYVSLPIKHGDFPSFFVNVSQWLPRSFLRRRQVNFGQVNRTDARAFDIAPHGFVKLWRGDSNETGCPGGW